MAWRALPLNDLCFFISCSATLAQRNVGGFGSSDGNKRVLFVLHMYHNNNQGKHRRFWISNGVGPCCIFCFLFKRHREDSNFGSGRGVCIAGLVLRRESKAVELNTGRMVKTEMRGRAGRSGQKRR